MAVPQSKTTSKRLETLFSKSDRAEVAALLVEDCADNLPSWRDGTQEGLERIRFAVLKLSEGTLQRCLIVPGTNGSISSVGSDFGYPAAL